MANTIFEPVIGLEIHVQLKTATKIFCGCSTQFGSDANSQTCPVCLGMPGVLPVLNEKAIEFAVRMGLATNCSINQTNVFARKNYFYPDLPKGYQISQYDLPICQSGLVHLSTRDIRLNRIHLEEDAGKSIHDESFVDKNSTLVDLNRCGTPLIEIVSEADFRAPEEAAEFLTQIRQLVRYLEICDGNMDEGSLRCDANVSIREKGQTAFGTKTEVKNMNSIKNVEHALRFEIERQKRVIADGEEITQATLLWDAVKNEARIMRTKEEAHDYRYFPEPDLVPVVLSEAYIKSIREQLPELPDAKKKRFVNEYKLPEYDAGILCASREIADYFEETCSKLNNAKLVSNWIMSDVLRIVNQQNISVPELLITPQRLAQLLSLIEDKTISASAAKKVFEEMLVSNQSPQKIVEQLGLQQVSDSSELEGLIQKVLDENPAEVAAYKQGKSKLIGFFVGQVMRASKGKANPKIVNEILASLLK